MVVERPETEIVEKIKRAKEKDKKVVKVVEEMQRVEVKNLRGDEWKIERDLVLKEEKVYILKDKELRVEIIQLHYDLPVAGHRGKQKTMKLVMKNYWWS